MTTVNEAIQELIECLKEAVDEVMEQHDDAETRWAGWFNALDTAWRLGLDRDPSKASNLPEIESNPCLCGRRGEIRFPKRGPGVRVPFTILDQSGHAPVIRLESLPGVNVEIDANGTVIKVHRKGDER